MTETRLCRSLERFRSQLDKAAPKRSKASDGWIGDASHATRTSDHNPKEGVVTAFDATQDPKHQADMDEITEALRLSRDKRIAYVIWDGRIFDGPHKSGTGGGGVQPWVWRDYTGADPHTNHLHISVAWVYKDDGSPWKCFDTAKPAPLAPKRRAEAKDMILHLGHRRHPLPAADKKILRELVAAIGKALTR